MHYRRGTIIVSLLAGLVGCGDDGAGLELGETDGTETAADTEQPDDGTGGETDGADGGASGDDTGGEGETEGDSEETPNPDVCIVPTSCDADPPDPGPTVDWNNMNILDHALLNSPRHRIRDMMFVEDEPQWILGKFAFGLIDNDAKGELVDLYLLRGCEGDWELLGSVDTTEDGDSVPDVDGVENDGGRIFFEIPEDLRLELGRHRIHAVLRGNNSTAEGFIEVVPEGTEIFVSDVDGTLTTSENEAAFDLATGDVPDTRPYAPDALGLLADAGYRPFYITARPEWFTTLTHEFLQTHGFPKGLVRHSTSELPELNEGAIEYKTAAIQGLIDRGLEVVYVIGNTETDAQAYENVGIEPLDNRIFMQFDDDAHGGRRIESYEELLGEFGSLDPVCEAP